MIARIATIVLSVAVTLVVPAILAVNGIRLVTNERYVEAVYDYGGVPDDRYGLGSATRERLALVGLASIQPSSDGIALLREARFPNGEAAFNGRELTHMEDVRTAVSRAYRFQLIAVAGIGVLAVLFALLGRTRWPRSSGTRAGRGSRTASCVRRRLSRTRSRAPVVLRSDPRNGRHGPGYRRWW